MRIDDESAGVGRAVHGATRGRRAAEMPRTAPPTDRVSLSSAARDLAWARAAVGPLDEVREERIALLRPVVCAGDYRVDTPLVARSLLVEELGGLVA